MSDNYNETPGRVVIFKYHRYRVTYSDLNKTYILWYSGNILMSGSCKRVVESFRQRVQEYQGTM